MDANVPKVRNTPLRIALCAVALTATLGSEALFSHQKPGASPTCQPAGGVTKLPGLPEASGVVASRRHPGRLWAHNDSGDGGLVAVTDRGAVVARVRLTGVPIDDWEALAVGPCPSGTCLYIGDIGDNDASRKRITVYRVPEPDAAATSIAVRDAFHATYPDGAHDAEVLFVTPKGEMFIVTKGETGPIALYRFPRDIKSGGTVRLEAVGQPRSGKNSPDDQLTDGAVSPNGAWIVLRTKTRLLFHSASDLTTGNWREAGRLSLASLEEPQGEGVAFVDDKTLVLVSEGGGKSQPGTFARLTCTF
jgi:hypothetical protein